jgi:exodeoxyribonuclease V alpha subunit
MVDDNGWCYLPAALEAEWTVARHVRRRLEVAYDVPAMARSEVAAEIAAARLSLVQAGAVWDALTRGVFVLTGGPGTGKTTTVRTVVRCAQAMGLRLKVVAPTGKAVARATAVTGAPAETVHRLIGGAPGSSRRAPLDLDLVIVDETSMASVEVMAWLLANLRPEARVVLVGDPDQLPSVDHGAVLRDLLTATRVPSVRLTEVYRQRRTSGIVQNAYRVLSGAALAPTPDFRVSDVTDRRGAIADEAWEKQAARQALVHELARLSAAGVDVTADVQVLTPMKKATNLLGAHALNALLQDALNPNGAVGPEVAGGRRVRVGDRVMQVRNDYALGDTGVFNGEMGEVTAVGPDAVTVRFGDARNLTVRGYRLYNLQLAWATTIHRSQGSEWPVVVVVAHRTHGAMLTRELLYTAVTRAAREVVVIADDGALARVRGDTTPGPGRHTGLARHLAR